HRLPHGWWHGAGRDLEGARGAGAARLGRLPAAADDRGPDGRLRSHRPCVRAGAGSRTGGAGRRHPEQPAPRPPRNRPLEHARADPQLGRNGDHGHRRGSTRRNAGDRLERGNLRGARGRGGVGGDQGAGRPRSHRPRGAGRADEHRDRAEVRRAGLGRASGGRSDLGEGKAVTAIVLALGSALAYGAADFIAGWLSRRSHFAWVGLLSQITAATGTVLVAAVVGGRLSGTSLAWGTLSGVGGGPGTLALYRGLGRGRMNVVAPLSGVLAAGLPAVLGIALGERPSLTAMLGLVLALPAVWLTARGEETAGPGRAGMANDVV